MKHPAGPARGPQPPPAYPLRFGSAHTFRAIDHPPRVADPILGPVVAAHRQTLLVEKQPTACRIRNGRATLGALHRSRSMSASSGEPSRRPSSTTKPATIDRPRISCPAPTKRRRRRAAAPASAQKRLARPVEAENSPQRPREHPDHRLVPARELTRRLPRAPRPLTRRLSRQPAIFPRRVLHGAASPRFRRPRVPVFAAGTSSAAEISPNRLAAPKKPPRSVRPSRCMIRFRAL